MNKEKALSILKKAQDWFQDDNHWCQKYLIDTSPDGTSRTCLIGALNYVSSNDGEINYIDDALVAIRKGNGITGLLTIWNDQPDRTIDDVRKAVANAISFVEGLDGDPPDVVS